MKFPKHDIYWNCIANEYLDVKDLSILDFSLYNHSIRILLNLPNFYSTKKNKNTQNSSCMDSSISSSNKNENIIFNVDHDIQHSLSSLTFSHSAYSIMLNLSPELSLTLIPAIDTWCSKRGIRIKYVRIDHQINEFYTMDTNSFNIKSLHYSSPLHSLVTIEKLSLHKRNEITMNINNMYSSSEIFARLCNLRSLEICCPLSDMDISILILRCSSNANRLPNTKAEIIHRPLFHVHQNQNQNTFNPPFSSSLTMNPLYHLTGPRFLTELSINGPYLPIRGLDRLILGLNHIKSFHYEENSFISADRAFIDDHLLLMACNWPDLSDISFHQCYHITDDGLLTFTKVGNRHRFRSIQFNRCPLLSEACLIGLMQSQACECADINRRTRLSRGMSKYIEFNLIQSEEKNHQQSSGLLSRNLSKQRNNQDNRNFIKSLCGLQELQLVDIHITTSSLIISILPYCCILQKFEYLSGPSTDDLLEVLSQFCPYLTHLFLANGGYDNTITDSGVMKLILHCQQLENIHFGCSPMISSFLVSKILSSLGRTVKSISCARNIDFISTLQYQLQLKSNYIRHRMKVNGEYFDYQQKSKEFSSSSSLSSLSSYSLFYYYYHQDDNKNILSVTITILLITVQLTALGVIAMLGSYSYDLLMTILIGKTEVSMP